MNNLTIALTTDPNKIKSYYSRKWVFGCENETNWKQVNTYIENLMSWYWGENGTVKAKEIFCELAIINAIWGYELDLGTETWERVMDYMEQMNKGGTLVQEWSTYFHTDIAA